MRKIYFSMTTHPNTNYDRSLRSVIWEEFPKRYWLYLNSMRGHSPLKSHMQAPPQAPLSLQQCAPNATELGCEYELSPADAVSKFTGVNAKTDGPAGQPENRAGNPLVLLPVPEIIGAYLFVCSYFR